MLAVVSQPMGSETLWLRDIEPCGLGRFLAVILVRYLSSGADDENACGGFDDVVGDGFELVDFQYSGYLWEEPLKKSEVAAGDAFDRGDGLRVGEVVRVEGFTKPGPVSVENENEFRAAEGAVVVRESETAVELGSAGSVGRFRACQSG